MDPIEQDHASDLYLLDIPRLPPDSVINMVRIWELRKAHAEDDTSSTESTHTEVIHLNDNDQDYDLDPLPYPSGFGPLPRLTPRRGNMVFNVSNDKPVVEGETD
jgi:hypothetical protein